LSGEGKCKSVVQCRSAVDFPCATFVVEIAADDEGVVDDAAGLGEFRPHAASASDSGMSARKCTSRM
jgi:hypothetical protein